ncbi:hypothetical protein D3C87_1337300 [compost metagenome]
MADAQAQGFDLLFKADACFDRRQGQIAHGACVLHFTHQTTLDDTNAAFAVTQFELNQTHGFSPEYKFRKQSQIPVGAGLPAIAICLAHQW